MSNLKESIQADLSFQQRQSNKSFLSESKHTLIKEAMHFQSREDFDKYMNDFERQYFDALQVKNTPYEFSGTGIKPSLASHLMPQYPSQPVIT